ncbi:MAG: cbb3-type cytochrome c oxidase subunit I [Magnetovibrio sp.]|nr:cbb3-type cytochrome c oxidase subunit I [Magnetovibrio sp.]
MNCEKDLDQRPLLDRLDQVMQNTGGRSWLRKWAILAIFVLGTAGLFALPLAFGRAPGVSDFFPWFVDNFHRFLVVHVDFSFVVFFLCIFAATAHITVFRLSNGAPRFMVMEYLAFRISIMAVVGMFIPVFPVSPGFAVIFPMLAGEPVMSNYVPVLTSPLFYTSLLVLAIAMALMAVMVILNVILRPTAHTKEHGFGVDLFSLGGMTASVIYLIAFTHFISSWLALYGMPNTHQFNEDLFWAGGHVLQFVNVTLLVMAWYAVASAVLKPIPFNPKAVVLAMAILSLGALVTPIFSSVFVVFGGVWRLAFTNLQYVFGIVGLIVALPLIRAVLTAPNKPWKNPGYVVLILSPAVFGIGGIMGLFVDGLDTRTPAHYHGMIAGVTLAFMGLFYVVFIPLMGRAINRPRMALVSVWMFGVSQAVACTGLFLAGGYGAQRKVAGAEQGLTDFAAKLGMGLNGGAGLLAIIGGALFVWVAITAILNKQEEAK